MTVRRPASGQAGERSGIDHHPLPLYARRCSCAFVLPIRLIMVVVEEAAATAVVVSTIKMGVIIVMATVVME